MERLMNRDDNALVRYSLKKSAMDPSCSTSSVRNSDEVDFHDVFGGPPRRYSSQDMRNNIGEAIESRRFRGENESFSSSVRWSGLGEKPVFGEEGRNLRRLASNDFFDDIFRGGEDKDPYSSNPGSRIMSPARPLPAKSELFSSSLLTDQFSLSPKSNKGMDVPSFTSPKHKKDYSPRGLNHPYSPTGSLPRLSSQSFEGKNESDTRSSYRQSPISVEFSLSADGSVKVTETETDAKESKCSDVPLNSSQFHFSIYKWPSKGVPLMTSLRNTANGSRFKENNLSKSLSSNGRIERDNSVCESPLETLSELDFLSSNGTVTENNEPNQTKVEDHEIVKESVLDVPKQNPLQNITKDVPDNSNLSKTREEKKSLPGKLREKKEKVKTKFDEKETSRPELKSLRSMLFESEDKQGKDETAKAVGVNENMEKSVKKSSKNIIAGRNIKKKDEKKTLFSDVEENKAGLNNSPAQMGENLERNKAKGKVKEFVKIFNHESPSKSMADVDTQSLSGKWKTTSVNKAEKGVNNSKATIDEIQQIPNINKKETSANTPVKVEEQFNPPKEQDHIISDAYEQKNGSSCADGSKATLVSVDEFFEDDFSVKELSEDHDLSQTQSVKDEEDFKASDAKIRGWYTGKETNIRSLLSTLQYVLWPESGWKPVPLVNIIEANSVKRAYQKALLCLHPDKLQQKGAATHQKYIAEKVFDILQDAWIHFNSLSQ